MMYVWNASFKRFIRLRLEVFAQWHQLEMHVIAEDELLYNFISISEWWQQGKVSQDFERNWGLHLRTYDRTY